MPAIPRVFPCACRGYPLLSPGGTLSSSVPRVGVRIGLGLPFHLDTGIVCPPDGSRVYRVGCVCYDGTRHREGRSERPRSNRVPFTREWVFVSQLLEEVAHPRMPLHLALVISVRGEPLLLGRQE